MLSINLRRCFLSIFYYLYTNIYFFRVFHAIFKTFRTKIEPRSFFVVFFTKWYSPCLLFLSSHKETAIPFTKEIAEYLKIYLVLKPWLFNNDYYFILCLYLSQSLILKGFKFYKNTFLPLFFVSVSYVGTEVVRLKVCYFLQQSFTFQSL